jgi:hypothetical protein
MNMSPPNCAVAQKHCTGISFILYLVSFVLTFGLPAKLFSAVYYLAPWGSDSSGNGTLSNPWFTINKANYMMSPGDRIEMRGGTYYYWQPQVNIKGGISNTQRTIVKKYNSEIPILDFSNLTNQSVWQYALTSSGSNLTINGLTLQNGYYLNGIDCTGSNTTIQSCTVRNFQYGAITLKSPTYLTDNVKISNVQILNCTVVDCQQNNNPGAVSPFSYYPGYRQAYGGWGFTMGIISASSATISGCNVQRNYGEGIVLLRSEGANLRVTNNTAKDNFSVNIYIDNVRGVNGGVWANVSSNNSSNTNGASYANYKWLGNNADGIAVATEPYGSIQVNTAFVGVSGNTATNCRIGFALAENFQIVSYVDLNNNNAIGSNASGYYNRSDNWGITWGTNYVNTTTPTTSSIPLGK